MMTLEEQQAAILAALGYSEEENGYWLHQNVYHQRPPNFIGDLNAIHLAEELLSQQQYDRYVEELYLVCNPEAREGIIPVFDKSIRADAPQRAEAFLKAIDKWA